jgi:hypothetical protein
VVHNDGSIGSEKTRTALLEKSLVCLVIVSYYQGVTWWHRKAYESHVLHASTIWNAVDNDARYILVVTRDDQMRRYCGS